jgi:hypothetical protein
VLVVRRLEKDLEGVHPMPEYPQPGDVLVSNPTATRECVISIVPRPSHLTCPTHDAAVARGRELARELRVDAWLTEDHTHFMKIESCRQGRHARGRRVSDGRAGGAEP